MEQLVLSLALYHLSQFLQVSFKAVRFCRTIRSVFSKICSARPEDACHAIWQCMSQTPGLSALKAIIRYPPAGRSATSRRGGLSRLILTFLESYGCSD